MPHEHRSLRDCSDLDVLTALRVLETMVQEPVYRGVPEGVQPDDFLRRLDSAAAQYDLVLRLRAESNRRNDSGILV